MVGVNQEGDLVSWGSGRNGELGDNDGWTGHYRTEPKIIYMALFSKKVQHVTCGYCHTCVLTTEGQVYSW